MTKLPILALFLYTISMHFSVFSHFSPAERAALLSLKRAWSDPPILRFWNLTSSPCDWSGIQCAGDGSVTGIILNKYNISGIIPSDSFSTFHNLTSLVLSYNYFIGNFPSSIMNCSKLQHLDLSCNHFTGSVPVDIDRLKSLRHLDLSQNKFSGEIPPVIGNLTELRTLHLYNNILSGVCPVEISNLSNLEILGLANNTFRPSVLPWEFGGLKKLNYLWISNANVIGEIPSSFVNLSSLSIFDLASNNIQGSIPSDLFLLRNLSEVYLYSNNFSGWIPQVIESLDLVEIDLASNKLTGKIPEGFGKLERLELLNLYSNMLFGEVPQSIGLLPNLKWFTIFTNSLSGVLPPEMGIHSKLENFQVCQNQFTGSLPQNLCAGGVLTTMVAFENNLTGEIPKSLGYCPPLDMVDVHQNSLSGEIPSALYSGQRMDILRFSDNKFTGKIPSKIGPKVSILEVSNNQLSGEIPPDVSSWSSLVIFKASDNRISGPIPKGLTSLPLLTTLTLAGNLLSGELPYEILSWKSLFSLNLSRNHLSGPIPPAFGSLSNLLYLDLSNNQLSGEIPPQLGNLRLTFLNLSSNQLIGRIPDQLDSMAFKKSFMNNTNLCATSKLSNISICLAESKKTKKLSLALVVLIIFSALILCILTAFATWLYHRKKRLESNISAQSPTNIKSEQWVLMPFQILDFSEVIIISNLTEKNMIGCGGSGEVYKIAVDSNNKYVAVKRIRTDSENSHFLQKEFEAEIQILGSVCHVNIVKLLCCISSDDFKLLVYEFMENQSLDIWLHRKHRDSLPLGNFVDNFVLDWPTRLRIAIGAAQGLCYMHHDCNPPIVHRDVKLSNILLDSEFNAKIADFGLAKILMKKGEPSTMSSVAGTFGYIAPEYAYTSRASEKIDIYSFGVVLLELVTGREPNTGNDNKSLAHWAWVHYREDNPIPDALDDAIRQDCFLEDMVAVFKLGLMCTNRSPTERPSMREVLQMLKQCIFAGYEQRAKELSDEHMLSHT